MVPAMSASARARQAQTSSGARQAGRALGRGARASKAQPFPGIGQEPLRRRPDALHRGWLELAGHAHSGLSERNTARVMAWPVLILIASTRGPGA